MCDQQLRRTGLHRPHDSIGYLHRVAQSRPKYGAEASTQSRSRTEHARAHSDPVYGRVAFRADRAGRAALERTAPQPRPSSAAVRGRIAFDGADAGASTRDLAGTPARPLRRLLLVGQQK